MHVAKTLCFRFLCSLVVVLAVCTTTVSAKTVECDAVDTIAKVGLRSFDTVTISADTSNMVCKFSVNGVAVGSPPPEDVENAYRGLVGTFSRHGMLMQGEVDSDMLATLLLAAGPDNNISQMSSIVANGHSNLNDCLVAFRRNSSFSSDGWTFNDGLNCSTKSSINDDPEFSIGPISVDLRYLGAAEFNPHLVISVERQGQWNVVIIPKFQ